MTTAHPETLSFNNRLADAHVTLSCREYIERFRAELFAEAMEPYADRLLNTSELEGFCVSSDSLEEYGVLPVHCGDAGCERLLSTVGLKPDVDYIVQHAGKRSFDGETRKTYRLQADAFRRCLMLIPEYALFYIKIQQYTGYFLEYQLIVLRNRAAQLIEHERQLRMRLQRQA